MTIDALQYDFGAGITALSVARNPAPVWGGTGAYAGFNACHYVGDTPGHVARCRALLARELGVEVAALVIPRQTHSSNVAVIDDKYTGDTLPDTDALVTDRRGVVLCVNTADCLPLLMADEGAGVIAAVHAGWRGVESGIALKALDRMVGLGADPRDIRAVIGPSIATECFEVGDEVARRFDSRFVVRTYVKPHVDLRSALTASLISAGLTEQNINTDAPCSRCNPQRWCSARASGIDSARTLTMIMKN